MGKYRSSSEAKKRIDLALKNNIKKLDLSYLGIKEIPKELSKLNQISVLYITGNQLENIPSFLFDLTNLRILAIERNKIKKIPKEIKKLKKLEKLYLGYNLLKTLPDELGFLTNLETLELEGNSIENPPIEILSRGTFSIINYLRELDEEKDFLYEAKLLIVGEGGAGKTTLSKLIINEKFLVGKEDVSTEGIDIIPFYFPFLEKGKKKIFRLNIWDFGGQEIYHTTHQFFLTRRSLYALVADSRNEDTDFNYWLNIVFLLSKSSPLIVVQNEKQDRRKELNYTAMRSKFANIVSIYRSNFKTKRGLFELLQEIKDQAKKLPHVGSVLPVTWIKIRSALEALSDNFISINEYFKICSQNGIREKKRALFLSEYFHDIGVFLHFQDELLLKKVVILNPSWGTDAVYKLLDNGLLIENYGNFKYEDLKIIWDDEQFEGMYDELLELMKKFELIYEIGKTKNYIAPQLLAVNEPNELSWNPKDSIIFKYVYDFLPKGVLQRFIVRMNDYISNPNMVWKEGVLIEKKGLTEKSLSSALIRQVYDKEEILIEVTGVNRRDLSVIILEEMNRIHGSYVNIKLKLHVRCSCHICKKSSEYPHYYDYGNLLRRRELGREFIECDKSLEMVEVQNLIGDKIAFNAMREIKLLKEQISSGKIIEVLEKLSTLLKDNSDAIFQLGRIKNMHNKTNKGILNMDEVFIIENKIRIATLELIEEYKQEISVPNIAASVNGL